MSGIHSHNTEYIDLISASKTIKAAIIESRYRCAKLVNREILTLYYNIGRYVSIRSRMNHWGTKAIHTIAARRNVGTSLCDVAWVALQWSCYLIENIIFVAVGRVLHRKAMSLRGAISFADTCPYLDSIYSKWCCVCNFDTLSKDGTLLYETELALNRQLPTADTQLALRYRHFTPSFST